jgi:hypothetical protein
MSRRTETEEYVAALAKELAGLAQAHGLSHLAFILDMAALEAGRCLQPGNAGAATLH